MGLTQDGAFPLAVSEVEETCSERRPKGEGEGEGTDHLARLSSAFAELSLPTAHHTHELRNALASIISSAECLRRRLTDDRHRKYVEDIIRTARRGATNLDQIDPGGPRLGRDCASALTEHPDLVAATAGSRPIPAVRSGD